MTEDHDARSSGRRRCPVLRLAGTHARRCWLVGLLEVVLPPCPPAAACCLPREQARPAAAQQQQPARLPRPPQCKQGLGGVAYAPKARLKHHPCRATQACCCMDDQQHRVDSPGGGPLLRSRSRDAGSAMLWVLPLVQVWGEAEPQQDGEPGYHAALSVGVLLAVLRVGLLLAFSGICLWQLLNSS